MNVFIAVVLILLLTGCSQQNRKVTYPERANMMRIGGTVTISYSVNPQGITENVRVLKADPSGLFEKSLLNNARSWRFEKGKPLSDQTLTVYYGQK